MSTTLRMVIDSGNYLVDPDAVAEAILRRARARPPLPVAPLEVLVPAQLFQDLAPRPGELDATALDHIA